MFDFTKSYANKKGLVAALRKAEVNLDTVTIGQAGEGGVNARWYAKLNVTEEAPAPVVNFELTANELHAALVLVVNDCLHGMGGNRPIDLDSDPFTWVYADTLVNFGWSKESAAGTFAALQDKSVIQEYDKGQWIMMGDAYRYLDSIWSDDARALSVMKKAGSETVAPVAPAAKPVKAGKKETVRKNGVRFPREGGLCWKAWMMFDELGANVDIKTALAEGAKRGFNDNNIRTELCCWRKFHGYTVVRATKG